MTSLTLNKEFASETNPFKGKFVNPFGQKKK